MIIAVDFDGTCVTHEYPSVGKDIGAAPVLKELTNQGHQLILWTMRSDKRGISPVTGKIESGGLQDAVDWFNKNDIPLYGINTNPGQEKWTSSPKAYAELYIDDAGIATELIYPDENARGFVNWHAIVQLLMEKNIITFRTLADIENLAIAIDKQLEELNNVTNS